MNKVILVGNLGRDPEVRYTQGGMAICSLSLATTERKKGGEEKTSWHRIKIFDKAGEAAGKHLQKGSKIVVEGRLGYSESEKDGVKRYWTEIICDRWEFAGGGKPQEAPAQKDAQPTAPVSDDQLPF